MKTLWSDRHPSTQHFQMLFAYTHLPDHLQEVSSIFAEAAGHALAILDDGPELSAGLRKLLEAKDCMVRQAVADERALKERGN